MRERTAIGRRTFLGMTMAAAGAAGLPLLIPGIARAAGKPSERLGAQFIDQRIVQIAERRAG